MAKLNLGEWKIQQVSSGDPVTITDGTSDFLKISSSGVDVPTGDLTIGSKSVATQSWAKGNNITVSDLSGVAGQGHGNGLNADMVDGSHASELGGVEDHASLDNVTSAQHHARYTNSEARTAVDGANIDIGGNADTVDNLHASELGGSWANESGQFDNEGSGSVIKTISLSNTYEAGAFLPVAMHWNRSGKGSAGSRISNIHTDSNGNVTGIEVYLTENDDDRVYVQWRVMGKLA